MSNNCSYYDALVLAAWCIFSVVSCSIYSKDIYQFTNACTCNKSKFIISKVMMNKVTEFKGTDELMTKFKGNNE